MDSDLYKAAIFGNITFLQKNKVKVGDQVTPDKNSVLHLASQFGRKQCVKEILKMHPSLLCKANSAGDTALHLAAKEGHSDVVKTLLDEAKGSQTRQPPPKDQDLEAGVGSSASVKEMMIRFVNKEKDSALHMAARYNRSDVAKLLVEEDRDDSHRRNEADETPLYLAAYRGHNLVVEVIRQTCTSLAYGGPEGRTVLHASVICHMYETTSEMAKSLLSWKDSLIKESDACGWTALHYAAYFDYAEFVVLFLRADKSVAYLADDKSNRTALHIAAGQGSIRAMKKIIKFCPDCSTMVDKQSRNVLHIAAEHDHKEVIECILQNCQVISTLLGQKDEDGNTPLHLLSMSGCYVPAIIKHEMTDKEALNNDKLTALDAMLSRAKLKNEQSQIIETLEERGAKYTLNLWRVIRKEHESKPIEFEEEKEELKKMSETHMIVATLIATITFAAGFTLPGGYDGNQGMAVLTRKIAFKAFMVTDTVAFILSTAALVMYFVATVYARLEDIWVLHVLCFGFNVVAIVATVLAFITGTYVVLPGVSSLSIALCAIGCAFFLILFLIFINCWTVEKVSIFSFKSIFGILMILKLTDKIVKCLKMGNAKCSGYCFPKSRSKSFGQFVFEKRKIHLRRALTDMVGKVRTAKRKFWTNPG